MPGLTKEELVTKTAAKANVSKKDVEAVADALRHILKEELGKSGELKLFGLIKVEKVSRGARDYRNPRTGETVHKGPTKAVKVSALTALKDMV